MILESNVIVWNLFIEMTVYKVIFFADFIFKEKQKFFVILVRKTNKNNVISVLKLNPFCFCLFLFLWRKQKRKKKNGKIKKNFEQSKQTVKEQQCHCFLNFAFCKRKNSKVLSAFSPKWQKFSFFHYFLNFQEFFLNLHDWIEKKKKQKRGKQKSQKNMKNKNDWKRRKRKIEEAKTIRQFQIFAE